MLFSLNKILVLVGVLGAVFAAFKFVGNLKALQDDRAKRKPRKKKRSASQGDNRQSSQESKSVDLVECERCGAFVPKGQCDCHQT